MSARRNKSRDTHKKMKNHRPHIRLDNNKIVPLDQATVLDGEEILNNYASLGSAGNIFVSNAYLDFEVRSGQISYVNDVFLNVDINNGNAVNQLAIAPIQYLISFIEIFVGADLIETIYPTQLWTDLCNYDNGQIDNIEKACGFGHQNNVCDFTAGPPVVFYDGAHFDTGNGTILGSYAYPETRIPVSTTRSYVMKIPSTWLSSGHLLLDHLSDTLRVRVHFESGDNIFDTFTPAVQRVVGAGGISLQQAQLIVKGIKLGPKALSQALDRAQSNETVIKSYVHRRQIINAGALTAGVENSETLTGFNGEFDYLEIFQRNANATNEERWLTNHTTGADQSRFEITTSTLLDGSGQPWGYQNLQNDSLLRYWIQPDNYDGCEFNRYFPVYQLSFSGDPKGDQKTGKKDHGQAYMDGLWRFTYTPENNITNAELIIHGKQAMNITISKNGKFQAHYL